MQGAVAGAETARGGSGFVDEGVSAVDPLLKLLQEMEAAAGPAKAADNPRRRGQRSQRRYLVQWEQ